MAEAERSVLWYTKGKAHVDVCFPEDRVSCSNCKFIKERFGLRFECLLTDEIIVNSRGIGSRCPIDLSSLKDMREDPDQMGFIKKEEEDGEKLPF